MFPIQLIQIFKSDEWDMKNGDATPWARATKNVKKPVSHVEKLDLKFL